MPIKQQEKTDYILIKETPYGRYWKPLGPWGVKTTQTANGQSPKKRGRPFKVVKSQQRQEDDGSGQRMA